MYDVEKVERSLDESKLLAREEQEKQQLEIKNEIRFEKVHFAYPTAHEGQPDTLQGVSFKVKAGTSTAIVGPSGSGKSTIIQLLLRLYDPSKGEITIDGTNIKDFSISTLRNGIGYVPQDSVIFSGTLDDNLLKTKSKELGGSLPAALLSSENPTDLSAESQ